MPVELSDSMRDEVLKKYHDTFYVFNAGDPIVGEHRTFEVDSFDVIDDMEVALALATGVLVSRGVFSPFFIHQGETYVSNN
jgi:hypothetical protein